MGENKGPKQMMQRNIVAAPLPVAAFHSTSRCFHPPCFVSLLFDELTAAPRQMGHKEKNMIPHDTSDLTHQRKGAEGTDGVPMDERLTTLTGRFLVVSYYGMGWQSGSVMVRGGW